MGIGGEQTWDADAAFLGAVIYTAPARSAWRPACALFTLLIEQLGSIQRTRGAGWFLTGNHMERSDHFAGGGPELESHKVICRKGSG